MFERKIQLWTFKDNRIFFKRQGTIIYLYWSLHAAYLLINVQITSRITMSNKTPKESLRSLYSKTERWIVLKQKSWVKIVPIDFSRSEWQLSARGDLGKWLDLGNNYWYYAISLKAIGRTFSLIDNCAPRMQMTKHDRKSPLFYLSFSSIFSSFPFLLTIDDTDLRSLEWIPSLSRKVGTILNRIDR